MRRVAPGAFAARPVRHLAAAALAAGALALTACAGGTASIPAAPTPRADVPWVTDAVAAPRVEFRSFQSAAAGGPVSFHVYVPEAAATSPERRFPVVYWLHGSGGGQRGLPRVAALFDDAIAAGDVPPLLVVFVNGLVDGMYVDWKDGSVPLETVIVDELVPHVDATLPTIAAREGRILDGFSMGGYGAARLAFTHDDMFSAASLLGAGPLQTDFSDAPRAGPARRDEIFTRVFGGDPAYFLAVSPWQLAEARQASLRTGSTRLRQVVGDRDETLGYNRQFHERLVALGIPHTYRELPGVGHDPMRVVAALGDDFWRFYREALGADR